MTENTAIVVGVNGSPSSEAALRYAAHMVDEFGDRLELVHVVPQVACTGGLFVVAPAYLEDMGQAVLRKAAVQARELIGAGVTIDLRRGTRVPCLLASSRERRAIVLGFDPRPTLERLATGSTVNGVAARSEVPVIVVRPDWSPDDVRGVVAIGVKSTDTPTGLLRSAFDAASRRAARLRIVHAWALPSGYDGLLPSGSQTDAVSEAEAEQLRASVAGIGADYPEVDYDIVAIHGHPARVLAITSRDADVLLLERRRHPQFGGHLGGTARTLLCASQCPVVILPPTAEATEAIRDVRITVVARA